MSNGIICVPYTFLQKYDSPFGTYAKGEVCKAQSFIMYSRDNGITWEQSPATDKHIISWEFSICEYESNKLMINSRGGTEESWNRTANGRRVFTATINKEHWHINGWSLDSSDGTIWDPICNASLVKAVINGKTYGLFSNPYMPGRYWPRTDLTIHLSTDFKNWIPLLKVTNPLEPMIQAYSNLDANGYITMVYCKDPMTGIQLARIDKSFRFLATKQSPRN